MWRLEKQMAPTQVGIVTVSGKVMEFDATSRMCITFSACHGWEAAQKLLYARVPDGQSIAFFKDDDCKGDPIFHSEVSKTFGNEIVKADRAVVRSFIEAKYTIYPVKGIVSRCRGESARVVNTTTDSNETQWLDALDESSGNLSLNWFDELPNGDVSVGDI